jgi:hypothetical protein
LGTIVTKEKIKDKREKSRNVFVGIAN